MTGNVGATDRAIRFLVGLGILGASFYAQS